MKSRIAIRSNRMRNNCHAFTENTLEYMHVRMCLYMATYAGADVKYMKTKSTCKCNGMSECKRPTRM